MIQQLLLTFFKNSVADLGPAPLFGVKKKNYGRKKRWHGKQNKTDRMMENANITLNYFILYFIVIILGSCIRNVPQCAECLDHRTCQRCQEGFLLLESYWGPLCVTSCPDGFNTVETEDNGLVCKNSKGTSNLSVTV